MDFLFTFFIIVGFFFATLFYLIQSLIDMWREYTTTKDDKILLLFILNIVGFFFSASIMSILISVIYYWKRSKAMSFLGLFLFLIGPCLFIILAFSSFLSISNF